MDEYTRVGAARNPSIRGIEFYITYKQPYSDDRHIGRVAMKKIKGNEAVWNPPAFWLTDHNAQKLMDDLWYAGVRPSEHGEAEGELKATKKHLQDMRNLAMRGDQ